MSLRSTVIATALFAAMSAAVASAAPWTAPAGSQPTFDYSAGQDITGHFGDGTASPGGFSFFPNKMVATAPDGINLTQQTADTLSVILNAAPNHVFSSISGGFLGDYSILGPGTSTGSGQLRVTNLDTLQTLSQNLAFTGLPAAAVTSADGDFNAGSQVNLPAGWKNIKVEMDGLVAASADSQGSTALTEAKVANIGVDTAVVPLPAAVFAAPAAMALAIRARRRMLKKKA